MNKAYELIIGKFFIERLNNQYNLNYRTFPNDEEFKRDRDIDVYAITNDQEILNLQIKTGEPGLESFWGSRRKHGSGMVIIDVNIEKLLAQIIQDAEQKYSNKENLILLIGEKMQPTFDKEYAKLLSDRLGKLTLKGIYLVKLPFGDASHSYEGQIVAIKDVFGNNGEIF